MLLAKIAEILAAEPRVFFEMSPEEPIAALRRAPGADGAEVKSAIDWAEEFVRDFEFLKRLAPEREVR